MNFNCSQCQRRYTIADEAVRGKTVRVRCKGCQGVITVQGPAEEPAEEEGATRAFSLEDMARLRAAERALSKPAAAAGLAPVRGSAQAPVTSSLPPRAAPAPAWFVMVQGQQLGPLGESELRARVVAGGVTARSFLWREGLAEWRRGAELPELGGLWAAAPAPAAAPPQGAAASVRAVRAPAQAVQAPAHAVHTQGGLPRPSDAWAQERRPASEETTQLFVHLAARGRGGTWALAVGGALAVGLLLAVGLHAAGGESLPLPGGAASEAHAGPAQAPASAAQAPGAPHAGTAVTAGRGPVVRDEVRVAGVGARGGAGLAVEAAVQAVEAGQEAFRECVQQELGRNPDLGRGRVLLTLAVASSGAVQRATVDRKDVAGGALGACLSAAGRRVRFASFRGGAVRVEVPLVLAGAP